MNAVKIADGIYWVGAVDFDLKNFHGYLTQRGSTYNAYLILDEKITLIDCVKAPFAREMLARISSVVNPEKIDTVISNHVEMDHSGALPELLDICPSVRVLTSPRGVEGLKQHYGPELKCEAVNTGMSISLGARSLDVILTPMVHWPDNMMVYSGSDGILFSNDSFGQHLAAHERFDDEYDPAVVFHEAKKYYANIIMPFGPAVEKELLSVQGLGLRMIATSHGLIWRSRMSEIIAHYRRWSQNETEDKAVIVYDSMWQSTSRMAEAAAGAFREGGVETVVCDLKETHISDIMTDLLDARYIAVGSPTLNNMMMPLVAGFLAYLKGLAPKKRVGLAFGSYGWSAQGVNQVHEVLAGCGFKMMEPVKAAYVPDEGVLRKMRQVILDALPVSGRS